jgi:RNA polymerase sigma-70 factor (ECF subfamily)
MSAQQIENLVRKYENKIFRTAIAITGSKADAEDVMQEVFLKLIQKAPAFESDEHESAWLTRVTVNQCKTLLRSVWFKKSEPLLDIYPAAETEQHDLIEQINILPQKYRTVIYLFYYEGYSTKEIAGLTSQKESTVRSQLNRARNLLKNFLESENLS